MGQPISNCIICDAVLRHSLAKYCRRCGNIMQRIESGGKADIEARVKVLQKAWDADNEAFRCHYSGIRLVDDDPKDPRYITFDYVNPLRNGELVVTAALIRHMKLYITTDEFTAIISQLAKHFADGTEVDEGVFRLKYYRR